MTGEQMQELLLAAREAIDVLVQANNRRADPKEQRPFGLAAIRLRAAIKAIEGEQD